MTANDELLFNQVRDIFKTGGVYELAKSEFIEVEVMEQRIHAECLVEFRDALDHLSEAFVYGDDAGQVKKHADEIETHLWRIAIECAEYRFRKSNHSIAEAPLDGNVVVEVFRNRS